MAGVPEVCFRNKVAVADCGTEVVFIVFWFPTLVNLNLVLRSVISCVMGERSIYWVLGFCICVGSAAVRCLVHCVGWQLRYSAHLGLGQLLFTVQHALECREDQLTVSDPHNGSKNLANQDNRKEPIAF